MNLAEHLFFCEDSISEAWTEVTPQSEVPDIFNDRVTIEDTFIDVLINTQSISDIVSSKDFLTSTEITDVETSWKEITDGEAQEFTNVDEFLRELNSE
jgi:hypothetical protein